MAITSLANNSILSVGKSKNMSAVNNDWIFLNVQFLVVAGGGGAGGKQSTDGGSAGAGGGGFIESEIVLGLGTYSVTVGAGGPYVGGAGYAGSKGFNSVFATFTSDGGGLGSSIKTDTIRTGQAGGSGGGTVGLAVGGPTTQSPGFGNNGGNGAYNTGGGGGGAGTAGGNATTNNGGNAGQGKLSSITGTPTYYSGGGAGGGLSSNGSAINGGTAINSAGGINSGAGGGGTGTSSTREGNNGGSGIVVIKIPDAYTATFSAGVTSSPNSSGGFNIYTITATSTTDETVTIA